MKQVVLVLAVIIGQFSTSHTLAQRTQSQEIYKIIGISVEGNTVADPSAIIANTGLKIGDEIVVPGDQIGQAIRRLWALKIFKDIQVRIDRKVGNGVYLLVVVEELPRYERMEVNGNDEIDTDDIEKEVSLVRGQVLPPQVLLKIRRDVTKLYEEQGFLLANVKVTAENVDTAAGRVVLTIDIDEGKEVQVAGIMFEGNQAFDDGDLRGEMDETTEKSWWKFWSSANFDRKAYQEDKKLIVQQYRNNGYRDAGILSDSIWYSEDKEEMFILLRVYEGPQYKIRHISWEGSTVYSDTLLNERLDIELGEIYNAEKFEQNLRGNEAQNDVASLYLDNGYLTFNLEPQEIRVAEDSIDISIRVYERNQFRIGQVYVKGNTKTYEKVIRRELHTRPGDFFSRGAIVRSVRELSVLNYFNPEKIQPDYNLVDDKTVDLTYTVEEKSSDNINASVGFSGAFGFTGALGFTINNFSISRPLSGGAGQILNFQWQFGESASFRTFTIGFTEPWLFSTPTLLGVSLFDTRQRFTFDLRQTGGSVRIGRRFKWPDHYFRGDWILNAQHNDVIDGRGVYTEGKSSQVSITQIITRNSIDNPVFPSSGSNVSLSIEMSGGPLLLGSIDFHKWLFQSDWYVPMFGTSRIAFYLSLQYGYLSEFFEGGAIPPIELFFMGGTGLGFISTTPLRGYEDQSVGPRDARNNFIGGRAMTKQTAELRLAIALNPIPIYILGFVEGGNVYESFSKADFFDLKRSAGFGARLQINPIGLIGFDYGFGFDDVFPRDGEPDGWRFHFVFGRGF
ncbi:MAG: outer membrane protein assembly factor BamA [Ignavibacteria bacterium]|nr:outer membrane protein assembly factor BamA [Ignavibacteria bacterium]